MIPSFFLNIFLVVQSANEIMVTRVCICENLCGCVCGFVCVYLRLRASGNLKERFWRKSHVFLPTDSPVSALSFDILIAFPDWFCLQNPVIYKTYEHYCLLHILTFKRTQESPNILQKYILILCVPFFISKPISFSHLSKFPYVATGTHTMRCSVISLPLEGVNHTIIGFL